MANRERLVSVPAARVYIEANVGDPILKGCMNNVMDAIPAVDAVEVVRCKDCKFGDMCSIRDAMVCTVPNGFCWRGERGCDHA